MRPLGEIDFACGSFVLRSLVIVSYRWGRELRELRAEPGRRQRDQADPCPSQAGCRSGFGMRGQFLGELLGSKATKHPKVCSQMYLSLIRN